MGNRTKYTPELARKVCDAIRAGNYREAAAQYAGIGRSTLYQWIVLGEKGRAPYREFLDMVHAAEAEAEVRVVAQWQQQIPENWQAAKEFLARRYPERWAETHKIVRFVERELELALDKLADQLPAAEYARIVAILADDTHSARPPAA